MKKKFDYSDMVSSYFKKHLELMKDLGQETEYIEIQNVDDFFNAEQKGEEL